MPDDIYPQTPKDSKSGSDDSSHQEPIIVLRKKRSPYEKISLPPFTNPENAPKLYKPKEVLWLQKQLNQLSVLYVVIVVFAAIIEVNRLFNNLSAIFSDSPSGEVIAWILTFVMLITVTVITSAIGYFAIRALGSILKILMEMEFNSRAKENPE